MKYKIAICDDEQNQIEYISSIATSWSAHEGHSCEIRTFTSAEAFLFEYEDDKAYDILLLDVEMKNMNGIELAKRIRRDNNRAEIIFITLHFEFVGEGYEVDALHYLIKPISEEKLIFTVRKDCNTEKSLIIKDFLRFMRRFFNSNSFAEKTLFLKFTGLELGTF